MKCDDVRNQMTDYVYNELANKDRLTFEEHLAACAACRSEVTTLRRSYDLVEVAASAARETEPAAIDAAALLGRCIEPAHRSRRRWRWAAMVATAATILAALTNLLSLRLEVHSTYFIVAWGAVVQEERDAASSRKVDELRGRVIRHEEQFDELDQLLRLVVDEINSDNEVLEPRLLALCVRLDQQLAALEQRNDARWKTTKHLIRQWQPADTVAWQSSAIGEGE